MYSAIHLSSHSKAPFAFASCSLAVLFALSLPLVIGAQDANRSRLPQHGPAEPTAFAAPLHASKPEDAQEGYKFTTITIEGSVSAVADGINNRRIVTGYYQDSNSVSHGFIWDNGTLQTVTYPGATNTYLYGVNNKDQAIGYYDDGAAYHTTIYSIRSGAWAALPDIPGYSLNEGYGINDEGIAVGNAFGSNSTSVAWIWNPNTRSYSFFAVPEAALYTTSPSGVNDSSQIAGYFADANGVYHGFLKEYGTYTIIDVPGAADTFPDGINNRGVIQGQIIDSSGNADGFVGKSGGTFSIVNYPGPEMTAIVGINDAGDLCGGYWSIFGQFKPFIAFRSD